jgi:hypothetical protein
MSLLLLYWNLIFQFIHLSCLIDPDPVCTSRLLKYRYRYRSFVMLRRVGISQSYWFVCHHWRYLVRSRGKVFVECRSGYVRIPIRDFLLGSGSGIFQASSLNFPYISKVKHMINYLSKDAVFAWVSGNTIFDSIDCWIGLLNSWKVVRFIELSDGSVLFMD